MQTNESSNPLTGLPDRNACARAAALLLGADGGPLPAAAIWVDLDRFLSVNRSLGHQAGDQVILQMAERIAGFVGPRGRVWHVGADEFVALVSPCERAAAAELAAGLLALVDKPLMLGSVLLRPTASIGIALLDPADSASGWLERADHAMHDAKEQGGNRWVFSGEERMQGRSGRMLDRAELEVESDLHTALESGGLMLNYQPIVRRDGSIEAVEALMRCHVNGRNISPGQLIPVAEKTGLIGRLGEWSIVAAAEFARTLETAHHPIKIAVNVSRMQLLTPGFAESLAGAMLLANIESGRLELEITESLFMDLSVEVRSNLDACVHLGTGMSIDDFGTGYSCLATLKDLPASKVKLDRAFTTVLPADRRAFAVVRAVTQLGRELGMTVVAEGVESPDQLASLWEAGVDAVQGYIYARPMSGDALIAWLEEHDK